MQWEREGWVRAYRRQTADWLAMPWQARFLFDQLVKMAEFAGPDRGVVRVGAKAARAIAAAINCPVEVVDAALAELLEDGCVVRVPQGLRIRNYMPAQDTPKSNALKCREYRATVHTTRKVSTKTHSVSKTTLGDTSATETDTRATKTDTQEEEEQTEEEKKETPSKSPTGDDTPSGAASKTTSADVRRVFEEWQRLHASGRAVLDGKRERRIRARLAEGSTFEDLSQALQGALLDDFLMGKDPKAGRAYRGLETLLRDAAQVERLVGLYQASKAGVGASPEARAAADRRRQLEAEADKRAAELRARAAAGHPIAGPQRAQGGPGEAPGGLGSPSAPIGPVNGHRGGFVPPPKPRSVFAGLDEERAAWRSENPLSIE